MGNRTNDAIATIREEVARCAEQAGDGFARVGKLVSELEDVLGESLADFEGGWSEEEETLPLSVHLSRNGRDTLEDDTYYLEADGRCWRLHRRSNYSACWDSWDSEEFPCTPAEFAGALTQKVRRVLARQRRRAEDAGATRRSVEEVVEKLREVCAEEPLKGEAVFALAVKEGNVIRLQTPLDDDGLDRDTAEILATKVAREAGWETVKVYECQGCMTCGFGDLYQAGFLGVVIVIRPSGYDDRPEPNAVQYCFPISSGAEYRQRLVELAEKLERKDSGPLASAPHIRRMLESEAWAQV